MHTKAPWKVTSKSGEWSNRAEIVGGNGFLKDVAVCLRVFSSDRKRTVDDKEADANARLIAAAPELLEAAKNLWKSLPEGIFADLPKSNNELFALMKAIAKAEGK
jgi:hypothetical protein